MRVSVWYTLSVMAGFCHGMVTLTNTNNGRGAVRLLHAGIGNVHGGLLIMAKVKTEMHQVLSERSGQSAQQFGCR